MFQLESAKYKRKTNMKTIFPPSPQFKFQSGYRGKKVTRLTDRQLKISGNILDNAHTEKNPHDKKGEDV